MQSRRGSIGMTTAVQDSQTPRCLGCDYPLLSLPVNCCPECGRVFDPADPRTMRTPRSPGGIALFFLKPPSKRLNVAIITTAILSILSGTAPCGYLPLSIIALFSAMILLPIWALRFFLWAALRTHFRKDIPSSPGVIRRWMVTPVTLLIVVVLLITQAPLYFVFFVSQSSMDALAQEVVTGTNSKPESRWVGLFYAENIRRDSTGMHFAVGGASFFVERHGFAWSSTPLPRIDNSGTEYIHLYGPWYSWRNSG